MRRAARRERHDGRAAPRPHRRLPAAALAAAAAELPLRAELLALRAGGDRDAWRPARPRPRFAALAALSPLGRQRLRSRAAGVPRAHPPRLKPMDQQKNLILAIVLSVAILFGFQFFLAPKLEGPKPPASQTQSQPVPQANKPAAPGTKPETTAAASTAIPRATALGETPRVQIKTPRLSGSIGLVGAAIVGLGAGEIDRAAEPRRLDLDAWRL